MTCPAWGSVLRCGGGWSLRARVGSMLGRLAFRSRSVCSPLRVGQGLVPAARAALAPALTTERVPTRTRSVTLPGVSGRDSTPDSESAPPCRGPAVCTPGGTWASDTLLSPHGLPESLSSARTGGRRRGLGLLGSWLCRAEEVASRHFSPGRSHTVTPDQVHRSPGVAHVLGRGGGAL